MSEKMPAGAGIFRAGFGRENITPDYSVYLQGGPWKNRKTTGVLDPVYATCVALEQSGQTVLLYTLDMKLATETATNLWNERITYYLSFYEKLSAQLNASSEIE